MKKNFRKILFVFVIACFVLTATNILLALHLAEHDKDKNHNPETCPICQQGMINKNPAVLQSPPKVYQVNEISFTISYRNFFSPKIVKFQIPHLRAPPAIS
jgi:hypothetical protein